MCVRQRRSAASASVRRRRCVDGRRRGDRVGDGGESTMREAAVDAVWEGVHRRRDGGKKREAKTPTNDELKAP